jgi:hypothetical protein
MAQLPPLIFITEFQDTPRHQIPSKTRSYREAVNSVYSLKEKQVFQEVNKKPSGLPLKLSLF